MRSVLSQVTFRFPQSTVIRFMEQPPAVGDLVETRFGRTWVVSEVQREGWPNAYIAKCTPAPPAHRDLLSRIRRKEHERGRVITID
jgi:hypothetical protein